MNKLTNLFLSLLALSMLWVQPAGAQDAPKWNPVEFFGCYWREGKSMKDLDKVADKFRQFAEDNNSPYSAWTISPQFHNSPDMFDVGWLGAWPDSKTFGESQENWMANGRKLAAEFNAVVDCSGRHEVALSVPINAPEGTPGDGVLMFYPCSLNDGKTMEDAYAAHLKSGKRMKAKGSQAVSWLFYPAMGAGDIDFDYYHVVGFYRWAELGTTMEMYVNQGGMQEAAELIGGTASCSSPTVFDAQQVRAPLHQHP